MAKFIDTQKAISAINELIHNAGEKLILVFPYLKLSEDIKELLTYRNDKNKITTLIFAKPELAPAEIKFVKALQGVILKQNRDLNAKCYTNGDKILLTSIDLYEFSRGDNREMGVLIDKNDSADSQLFEDVMKEVDELNQTSQPFQFGAPKTAKKDL